MAGLVPSKLGAKLFVADDHKIWVFAVNAMNGRLKLLSTVVFPSNQLGAGIGINPQSTLLFVGKIIDPGKPSMVSRISTYRVNPSGKLTLIASAVLPNQTQGHVEFGGPGPFDPSGKYMYVGTEGSGTHAIAQFALNQTTGALTFVRSFPKQNLGGPVMHPSGRFLYDNELRSIGATFDAFVTVFSIDRTSGGLKPIQGTTCGCDSDPESVGGGFAINPAGTLLFQATFLPAGIAVYTINTSTGMLTTQGGSFRPVEVPGNEVFFTLDGTGKFLLHADTNGILSTYSIGSNGALTAVAQAPLPTTMSLSRSPTLQVVTVRTASP